MKMHFPNNNSISKLQEQIVIKSKLIQLFRIHHLLTLYILF